MPVVPDKMPIPYFGNVAGLLSLPREKRIVTVAINPNAEVHPITQVDGRCRLSPQETERRLSTYFTARRVGKPRWRGWFSCYEDLLNGLNASYWGTEQPVLHADYFSPIATYPTWGGLTAAEKAPLIEVGVPLCFELMRILDPRLIIVSISREGTTDLLGRLQAAWPQAGPQEQLCAIDVYTDGRPRDTPYEVFWKSFSDHAGRELSVVYGKPRRGRPFGHIGAEQRRFIGAACLDRLG